MIPLLVLALACGRDDVAERALAPPPADPEVALAACAAQDFEQLQVLCRVEVAARAGREGLPALVERACAEVPEGTWRQECHFRAGEELAQGGMPVEALSHCARAGRFDRFCVTHAGWALPGEPTLTARMPPDALIPAIDAELAAITQAAQALEPIARPEAIDTFRMRLWYAAYYGTGQADPAAAKAASPDQQAQARSAFLIEAARLLAPEGAPLPADPVARLLTAWDEGAILEGARLPPEERFGRYVPPIPVPCEQALVPVPLYGGGRRLLGADAAEDLVIAALEALYFRPDTPAEVFLPWVDDGRERVRWTAARLARLTEPAAVDLAAALQTMTEHADPCVAWNARDGLQHRTWERKPGGPP